MKSSSVKEMKQKPLEQACGSTAKRKMKHWSVGRWLRR